MKYSIVIPAHNEQPFIRGCLDSIDQASKPAGAEVERIVVANRCTDATEAIARDKGAILVRDDNRNLAKIRNAGARQATGHVLVTIDADSRMSANMLLEIDRLLSSGQYIGGGVTIRPERWSAGIAATILLLQGVMWVTGLSGGLYWCYRRDFEAVGGFNENLLMAEDLEFAKRLRAHGKTQGKRLCRITKAHIVTSCRKFDAFGDWYMFQLMFTHGWRVGRSIRGEDRALADRIFYDFNT